MRRVASGVDALICRFEDYELNQRTLELRKSGQIVSLAPQPARVLALLASRPGELVTRGELRREVWGEGTFVDFERNLNYCLNCIRTCLGDSAKCPRFIETLPRRGYRFIAPVKHGKPFAEPTLAVLPFANLNGDPALDYYADGITDALITELARIPAVRVISRQSVLHLKGSSRKLNEIAGELKVDAVVEGAALHERNRVRVTAQLILIEPERHEWAQSYECDMSAILAVQRDTARAIAGCVAGALRPADIARPAPAPAAPVAPEILAAYWKAVAELDKMSAEGIGKALQHLREVTAEAPDFPPALVAYAKCLLSLGIFGHAPAREAYPGARQMVLHAIAVDDRLGEAHTILACLIWFLDWDLAAAEREFRRAIELTPSHPEAHMLYAGFLCCMGRHDQSIAEAEYGLELNPASLLPSQTAAWLYIHARQDAKAEAQARRTLHAFPDSLHSYFVLGWATWRQGRTEEAVAAFEKALSLSREALSVSFLGHIYARLGRTEEARRLLVELDQLRVQGHASPMAFVVIHTGLGDHDAALTWLETACRLRCDMHYLTNGFPGIDPLRSEPRFTDLVGRMGTVPP